MLQRQHKYFKLSWLHLAVSAVHIVLQHITSLYSETARKLSIGWDADRFAESHSLSPPLHSAAFSPFEIHIHRLNACSASGKSALTRVLELHFSLNPTLIVHSSVNLYAPMWGTLPFMPMSKEITAVSQNKLFTLAEVILSFEMRWRMGGKRKSF